MKRRHVLQILFIGSLVACIVIYVGAFNPIEKLGEVYPAYPEVNYSSGAQAALIKQGEYLVKAGDCIACHTSKTGQTFAGGLPFKTPFGIIYSTNITPDKQTGIGNWTDAQFIKALKQGVLPNGSYTFPVFPYVYFNRISDQDALAIKAYLDAIPAVQKTNRKPDMPWPFRWRFGQLFWRILFFEPYKGDFQPNPSQSGQWNRGKYLVDGLGHCAMCHSPLNILGAEKREYYLSGNVIEGFYAPNLTSSNLGNVPVTKIVNVFTQDQLIGGGNVQGPMLEVNHDSLRYLTQGDLQAIAVYLKTVKSKTPPQEKSSTTVSLKTGEKVYNTYCTGCHTMGAGGAPKLGDQAAWEPLIKQGMPTLYKNAINGINAMPAKGTCGTCSLTDIQSAVNYIVSQSQGAAGAAPAAAKPIEDPTSLLKGQQVYNRVCATCHNQGQLDSPKIGDQTTWAPLIQQGMGVLFKHAIEGYKNHPPRGACEECNDADIIAAVKYMVQQSKQEGDYTLW